MWKAIITNKSSLDSDTNVVISFDVYLNDKNIYPNQMVTCRAELYESQIKTVLSEFKNSYEKEREIKVGEEIVL